MEELSEVVASFGGRSIHGWEFFDVDLAGLDWLKRPHVNHVTGRGGSSHTLCLFQEERHRALDLCVWFDQIDLESSLDLDELIRSGKRWWDALECDDPRTHGLGIVPLSSK